MDTFSVFENIRTELQIPDYKFRLAKIFVFLVFSLGLSLGLLIGFLIR